MAADEYSRAIARTAVAQLAELAGYEAVQESASDVLAELMTKYITELSGTAHNYAELASRTGINIHDVLLALEDLGTNVPELQTYLTHLTPEDNTFAQVVSDYPVQRAGRSLPTWKDKGEEPPPHIPNFLPAFPDKHTYKHTPTYPGHVTNPDKQAQALQRGRKQAETSLLNLHHATMAASRQAAGAGTSGGVAAPGAAACNNPFLAPPDVVVAQIPAPHAITDTSTSGGTAIQGTGGYMPHTATRAFAAIVGAAGRQQDGGEGAGPGAGGAIQVGADDLMAPEELDWRYQERFDGNKGTLTLPLGTSRDHTSATFAAAHTYAVGVEEPDAFEEAAKVEGQQNTQRKRKSVYGQSIDPNKRRAQDILDKAKDPSKTAEDE